MLTRTKLFEKNIFQNSYSVSRTIREKLNQHRSFTIWLTGLSGSGKSTIANSLDLQLISMGVRSYVLDGDNTRLGLNKDLNFSEEDRTENIRRAAEVAKLMNDAGLVVVTAFISPFEKDRDLAKTIIGEESFLEVYINTPLSICEKRDTKGLYKKARSGLMINMTGIDSPYEAPELPDLSIDTSDLSIEESSFKIISKINPFLKSNKIY